MKTAMIWGAGGGVGTAVVHHLRAEGWHVAALGRHLAHLEHIAQLTLEVDDTADSAAVQRALLEANYDLDPINLWLYAAGDIATTPTAKMSVAHWNQLIAANLTGAFVTTHHSLPLLAENAHLMYIGAIHERLRLPGFGAYAAAKAGLEAFAEALRKEERGKKVTVLRPGAVATPFWEKVPLRLPKEALTADLLAQKILTAYETQQQGIVSW